MDEYCYIWVDGTTVGRTVTPRLVPTDGNWEQHKDSLKERGRDG